MPDKIKVLYIHQDGLVTGSAISLRHFLSAMDRTRFEPEVLLCSEGPARNLYESLQIKVHVFPFTTFWTFPGPGCFERANLSQLRALLPDDKLRSFVLDQIKPDLIHINDKAAMNAGISLKQSGIPLIQHSRSSYMITACPVNRQLSASRIRSFADHIICISEDEEDGFENFRNKSIVFNTVDFSLAEEALAGREQTRASLNIAPNEIVIGMAAAINAKKGAWAFLRMCAAMQKDHPQHQLKFLMVGPVPETKETVLDDGSILPVSPAQYIADFIQQESLGSKMITTGFRKDNLDLIAAMDIFIVANSNAVLGRQPIEAQALGVPVVAVSGHSHKSSILKHEEGGLLLDAPLQQHALNNAVQQLVADPEKRKKMAATGRAYASAHFRPETNMRRIEALYQSLLS